MALLALWACREPARPREVPSRACAPEVLLLDGTMAGERVVAVGESGSVWLSDDAGATWRPTDAPTEATLTAVFFADARRGWAVGHDAVVLRTRDGGESWEGVHGPLPGEGPLLDVWFRDALRGLAVGAYGLALSTTDGGATWEQETIVPGDPHLNALVSLGPGRLYIVGEAGTLLGSQDGGKTWSERTSPYEGSWFGAIHAGGDTLAIVGLRGRAFRSADAGESWERLATGVEALLAGGIALEDGGLVLVGLDGTVLTCAPARDRCEPRELPERDDLWTIVRAGDGWAVLLGESGATRVGLDDLVGDSRGTKRDAFRSEDGLKTEGAGVAGSRSANRSR